MITTKILAVWARDLQEIAGAVSFPSTARVCQNMKKSAAVPFAQLPPGVRNQIEKLKSNVVLQATKKRIRSILFLSYNHGEGTTTVATNFVRSLAQDKRFKTLIVDANTRTPALMAGNQTASNNGHLVFSDVFAGQVENWTLPKPSADANMSVVPSGSPAYHPSQVFDHKRFKQFIGDAKKLFHFIVFDASPIGQYYDSVILGAHVDAVILVIQAERTQLHEVRWAKQMLEDRDIPILGTVLNRRKFYIPGFIFERFFR